MQSSLIHWFEGIGGTTSLTKENHEYQLYYSATYVKVPA